MKNYYRLDDNYIFLHKLESEQAPYLCVSVVPKKTKQGEVAVWKSDIPAYAVNFGKSGTGKWAMLKDYRKTALYIKEGGELYLVGVETEYGTYNGLGDLPDWLTDVEPVIEEVDEEVEPVDEEEPIITE